MKKIIILGAGGNSRDIAETVNEINFVFGPTYQIIGFLDDNKEIHGKKILGIKVLGSVKSAPLYKNTFFVNGVYSVIDFFNNVEVIKKSKIPLSKFETIIHPTASISKTAKIGKGTVILKNVIVMSNVFLGNHVCIHPGAIVSHDTKIGDYTFIANMASIGGYVLIRPSCFIGANSALRDRIKIGGFSIIGMGSVVIKDIPKNSVYVGNPAQFLKKSLQ